MKFAPFCASIALFHAPTVLAQSTGTLVASTPSTSATPSCTASLIASLCEYPSPGPEFAVASESRASCWVYCNAHQPCDFVIFAAGNPNTGTGTCWVYPGKSFDASAGNSNCGKPGLSVYSKPVCAGGSPTSGACAATSSPSAVASVCGYPPPGNCFEGCVASESASSCLSQCAKSASCSYTVFNPRNPSNSPFASGTCWIYTNGTYNAGNVTTCTGAPEQFVYNNACPKPSPSTSSSLAPSATPTTNGTEDLSATTGSTTSSKNLAASGLPIPNSLAVGIVVSMWHML
jgi:hypothetical protein